MNKLFRVYFTLGTTVDIYPAEYVKLTKALEAGDKGAFIMFAPVDEQGNQGRQLLLNLSQITHIKEFKVAPKTSGVVTPQSPQSIRKEQELAEAEKSKDLGAVLNTVSEEANG
jgi:hypothetical protein